MGTDWRVAFLGTFHPAVPTLTMLAKRGWVSCVVLPEEAAEKNSELIRIADEYGLPWSYAIDDIYQYDVNLVLASNYPKIVAAPILNRYPCVNTHWSALPKYRGMHGTAWALLNCDYRVGYSVHWMSEGFDEGDIIEQGFVMMQPEWDIMNLHSALAQSQADSVEALLGDYDSIDAWPRRQQAHAAATYVPRRVPADGEIDWQQGTERLWNLVRALPRPMYPGAFTFRGDEKIIIWKAQPADCPPYHCTSGQVVRKDGDAVWVKTGDTCLRVGEVESPSDGTGPRPAAQLLRLGDKLGRACSNAGDR